MASKPRFSSSVRLESRGGSSRESLLNFFSGGPLPSIQDTGRSSRRKKDTEDSDAKGKMQREYEISDDQWDLEYMKRYRDEEQRKIDRINEEIKHGIPTEEEQKERPMKPFRSRRWKNQDTSVDGSSNVGEVESVDDYYDRIDFEQRRGNCQPCAISVMKDRILAGVNTHQVTIIEGFTGCGKTTQVPQFLLDEAWSKRTYCNIAVTQPRRIAAMSIAKRVCFERNWEVGSVVGYQVGMDRHTSDDTRITYMTTGVLLQSLIHKKNLNNYTHIIIDEVHERDLETDLLMLVVKSLMIENKDFKTRVILMSATLNAEHFQNYFPRWKCLQLEVGADRVTVPSVNSHPISEHYIDNINGVELPQNYPMDFSSDPNIRPEVYEMAAAVIVSFDIFEKNEKRFRPKKPEAWDETGDERGAVLVFLPGLFEIDSMMSALHKVERDKAGHEDNVDVLKWTIYPLHSTCTYEEQQRVFLTMPKGRRKIILATNIAESSITVTDIKYVIDFCLTKTLCTDPVTNYTSLRLEWASKNQCIQRRGRCGRVSPGHVYRMVPKLFYDALDQEAGSEMTKSSLENVVLRVKKLGMGSPKAMLALALDPPKLRGIQRAVANLKEVGALTIECLRRGKLIVDNCDGDLTYLGEVVSSLPIDVRLGRLIMLGHVFGVLEETIIIAAGLSTKSPFSHPYHRRVPAYMSKLYWSENAFSDCFALLNVFRTWTKKFHGLDFRTDQMEKSWAKQYLVQPNILREMMVAINEIKERLKMAKINVDRDAPLDVNEQRGLLLKIVIAGAFYPNYFVRDEPHRMDEHRKNIQRDLANKPPETTVVFQGFPSGQPAELYEASLVAPFQETNTFEDKTIMTVEADGEKLLLSFNKQGHKIGNICYGLYRAIKMRQLREDFCIRVLKEKDDAVARLDHAMKELRMGKEGLMAPPQIDMTSIDEMDVNVIVTHVVTPSEFYVIRESDRDTLDRLMECIDSCKRRGLRTIKKEEVKDGEGLLVFVGAGGVLDRARIRKVRRDTKGNVEVAVVRIDMGGLFWKSMEELNVVQPDVEGADLLYSTPGLAVQCRICEVSCRSTEDGSWSNACIEQMKKYSDQTFGFKVYSVIDNVMAGDLISKRNDSVRQKLISMEYAMEAAEKPDSVIDHEVRLRDDGYTRSKLRNSNRQDCPKPTVYDEPSEDSTEIRKLRGPFSPIEMCFTGVCNNSCGLVSVDGSSVNCVALDQNPWNPVTRLLVAGSVSMGQKSQKLQARDTTLLPPILGAPSLMTIIFAPKAEFRVSADGRRYTGVLAGLGHDPGTGDPVYGDHDVEMAFDVEINNEDIESINCVRLGMNYVLRPDSHKDLVNLRETVIEQLWKVIHRPRKKVEQVLHERRHQWKDFSEKLRPLLPRRGMAVNHTDVFQFHHGFLLEQDDMIPVFQSRSLGWNH